MNRPDLLAEAYTIIPSPLGYMAVAARGMRLRGVILPRPTRRDLQANIRERWPTAQAADLVLPELVGQIEAYWQGHVQPFSVPLDLEGRPCFFCRVWQAATTIRPGCIVTYGQLAVLAGNAKAARAVGRAMACNPLPLVVPCHRVVGASHIGGFSAEGGVRLKEALLRWERRHAPPQANESHIVHAAEPRKGRATRPRRDGSLPLQGNL